MRRLKICTLVLFGLLMWATLHLRTISIDLR